MAVCLALVGAAQPPAPLHLGALRTIAATTNHAAIVVDTGKEVKKFCLAFPEDEISGAEALRRIDSQAVFANFGSRGQAVCSLCGTGCPSSNCFCDPNKFWAYHRAGPGGAPYAFSRAGASSTAVRNGDVEGWRWGGGEPPPPATVGEVCNIEEPPARTTAAGSTSTTASSVTTASTSTTSEPAPPFPDGATTATTNVAAGTRAGSPVPVAPPGVPAAPSDATTTTGAVSVEPAPSDGAGSETESATAAGAADQREPLENRAPASPAGRNANERSTGGWVSLAAFAAVLAGILVWRSRVKRSRRAPH